MSQTEAMDISPDKCIGEKSETESKKLCADCKTAKTPLWRTGPHGPKSLCNACGIRYRKKKSGVAVMGLNKESSDKKKEKASSPASSPGGGAVMGLNEESPDKKKEDPSPASSSSSTTAIATAASIIKKGDDDGKTSSVNRVSKDDSNLGGSKLKVRLMGLGKEVVLLKRPRSPMKRARSGKKLGEVEQAALLLMAISCGSVYA